MRGNVTGKDLIKVLEKEPFLMPWGIDENAPKKHIFKGRSELVDDIQGFAACVEWLSKCKRQWRPNPFLDSYHLKHRVEEWCGFYISYGALIAGVIHLGISYKKPRNKSFDVSVGISSRCKFIEKSKMMVALRDQLDHLFADENKAPVVITAPRPNDEDLLKSTMPIARLAEIYSRKGEAFIVGPRGGKSNFWEGGAVYLLRKGELIHLIYLRYPY
jgi:hypothetical protein